VPRLRQLIAVVFTLTVWFGASQHCNLEAAGILTHEDESSHRCCSNTTPGCHVDGCKVVESNGYRHTDVDSSVSVPAPLEYECMLLLASLAPDVDECLSAHVRIAIDRIQPWVHEWHFERRTVAAPGAPARILA